jgi:hypothetical protein
MVQILICMMGLYGFVCARVMGGDSCKITFVYLSLPMYNAIRMQFPKLVIGFDSN